METREGKRAKGIALAPCGGRRLGARAPNRARLLDVLHGFENPDFTPIEKRFASFWKRSLLLQGA
jgi:hypothetical protein